MCADGTLIMHNKKCATRNLCNQIVAGKNNRLELNPNRVEFLWSQTEDVNLWGKIFHTKAHQLDCSSFGRKNACLGLHCFPRWQLCGIWFSRNETSRLLTQCFQSRFAVHAKSSSVRFTVHDNLFCSSFSVSGKPTPLILHLIGKQMSARRNITFVKSFLFVSDKAEIFVEG